MRAGRLIVLLCVVPVLLLAALAGVAWQGNQTAPARPDSGIATTPQDDPLPPVSLLGTFATAAATFHVPESLLLAVGAQESHFNPNAVSPDNALGMMQMLASTFRAYATAIGYPPTADPFDPNVEIPTAAAMLAANGAARGDLRGALLAYNHDTSYVNQVINREHDYAVWLAGPQLSTAAGTNRYPAGECTWWVAHNRMVPWSGDAKDWVANARGLGYPSTSLPSVGAIAVYKPGGPYDSTYGHVAVVDQVAADHYVITEMNYAGWNVVDHRTIAFPDTHVLGFIP